MLAEGAECDIRSQGMDAGSGEIEPMARFYTPERAWHWCWLRTRRDLQLAERRGRPISGPNARRLLMRRWARVSEQKLVFAEREG